jgi:hypothetical protein
MFVSLRLILYDSTRVRGRGNTDRRQTLRFAPLVPRYTRTPDAQTIKRFQIMPRCMEVALREASNRFVAAYHNGSSPSGDEINP